MESGCCIGSVASASVRASPDFPAPLGVVYSNSAPTFDRAVEAQRAGKPVATDLDALLRRGRTWTVL